MELKHGPQLKLRASFFEVLCEALGLRPKGARVLGTQGLGQDSWLEMFGVWECRMRVELLFSFPLEQNCNDKYAAEEQDSGLGISSG